MCNGVNAFMRIVEFCNSNSGFISAVLATLSFVLSAVAIFISVQTSTHQAQISLLEKRFDIYSIYESFQLGHVYFTNAEFDSAIQKIIQVSNEIQISYLLESIEQETLKRK